RSVRVVGTRDCHGKKCGYSKMVKITFKMLLITLFHLYKLFFEKFLENYLLLHPWQFLQKNAKKYAFLKNFSQPSRCWYLAEAQARVVASFLAKNRCGLRLLPRPLLLPPGQITVGGGGEVNQGMS